MNYAEIIAEKDVLIAQKDVLLAEKDAKIAQQAYRLSELERLIYGAKKERFVATPVSANQLSLFDLPEEETNHPQIEEKIEIKYQRSKKAHPGRNQLPEHLPVEERTIEPEEDTTEMVKIGEEITEYVDYTPSSLIKVRIIRPKYVPKGSEGAIVIGELPYRPFPKSITGASFIAWLIVRKFCEHMPYYRQIQSIKREHNWDISSSTINDWFVSVCTMLEPLYEVLKQNVFESGYIQADESPIQVLDNQNEKQGKTHRGYQWVYYSPEKKLVIFDYQKSRSIEGPKTILKDYKGLLQSDGYEVYDKLAKLKAMPIAACLVHVRRYFYKSKDNDAKRANHALQIFTTIYRKEAEYKELSAEERKEKREKEILPLLKELKAWQEEQSTYVTPSSPIGKAMTYLQNQWPKILEIFNNGRYQLDNNLIENKIRPLALGRKNYLFAGSHQGAQRIAMMYSFFGSCAANDVNPTIWLTHTLNTIENTKLTKLSDMLPNNFSA